jgi:glycosyltransferase involved in cell wall biosynthesis
LTFNFAIPGDPTTKTGGYIYDARVIEAAAGEVVPLSLPASFPFPSAADLAETRDVLTRASGKMLVDGLAYGAMPAALIEALPAPPVALCHHPLGYEPGLDALTRARLIAQERAALDRASHVIVTSHATKQTLITEFGQAADRITVAPPGLDRTRPARPRPGPPLILTVASLTKRKGHDILVRALERMTDQDWTCLCAGPDDRDPATTAALRAQIAEAGLSGRIHLIGAQNEEELDALYARASVFCLPSRYEGYGMAFAEAMMRGLPVIACNTGAVSDLVPQTAGRLVPVEDDAALAAALTDVLHNPILRTSMGARGRQHALAIPGWDVTWGIIRKVMEKVS